MNLLLNNPAVQNDMLEKNLAAFEKRFPALAKNLRSCAEISMHKAENMQNAAQNGTNLLFPIQDCRVFEAKNGEITALYNNLLLHSRYNPSAEAQKLLQTNAVQNSDSAVFFGTGLGYTIRETARAFFSKNIILIEPDPLRLLFAFSLFDWREVFQAPSCVVLLQADLQTVLAVLEHYGLRSACFISQKACTAHAQDYFSALKELIARNRDKQDINERTLEKFGTLWLSNICKNALHTAVLRGINGYKNNAQNIPFCILAAGPSLDALLPFLSEIKKRALVVCVDTALRSCLRAGVQPHFILVADPQYWNARHIAGLQAPESILITEAAVYPSVFRFVCREIILCASLFPLGRYFERFTGTKDALAAGGSVASSAWDFARFCGAKQIYLAGLDLSYPANKTHARGSTFEEAAHLAATRIKTGEMQNTAAVYTNPAYGTDKHAFDYEGCPVTTDERMLLYAWWFESKCASFPEVKTYTLSSKSLRIPGIETARRETLLQLPEREKEIHAFCLCKNSTQAVPCKTDKKNGIQNLNRALAALAEDLYRLQNLSAKALKICRRQCRSETDYAQTLKELSKTDSAIAASPAAAAASMVFPSPSQLEQMSIQQLPPPPPPQSTYTEGAVYNILKSKLIYTAINDSVEKHIRYLKKNKLIT